MYSKMQLVYSRTPIIRRLFKSQLVLIQKKFRIKIKIRLNDQIRITVLLTNHKILCQGIIIKVIKNTWTSQSNTIT